MGPKLGVGITIMSGHFHLQIINMTFTALNMQDGYSSTVLSKPRYFNFTEGGESHWSMQSQRKTPHRRHTVDCKVKECLKMSIINRCPIALVEPIQFSRFNHCGPFSPAIIWILCERLVHCNPDWRKLHYPTGGLIPLICTPPSPSSKVNTCGIRDCIK